MKYLRGTKGSVLVMVALGAVVLFGISALVIDSGLGFAKKAKLQNTADAAALAGAMEIGIALMNNTLDSNTINDAKAKVIEYFRSNYPGYPEDMEADPADFITNVEPLNNSSGELRGIRVTASEPVKFYFGGILDKPTGSVVVKAAAMTGSIKSAKGVMPIGIVENYYEFNAPQEIKLIAENQSEASPNMPWYGWMHFDNNNPHQYVPEGYPNLIKIGDEYEVKWVQMQAR